MFEKFRWVWWQPMRKHVVNRTHQKYVSAVCNYGKVNKAKQFFLKEELLNRRPKPRVRVKVRREYIVTDAGYVEVWCNSVSFALISRAFYKQVMGHEPRAWRAW